MPSGSDCKGASKCGSLLAALAFFRVVVLLVGIGQAALDSLLKTAFIQDKAL